MKPALGLAVVAVLLVVAVLVARLLVTPLGVARGWRWWPCCWWPSPSSPGFRSGDSGMICRDAAPAALTTGGAQGDAVRLVSASGVSSFVRACSVASVRSPRSAPCVVRMPAAIPCPSRRSPSSRCPVPTKP